MGYIYFNSNRAYDYLRAHGFVFTLRAWDSTKKGPPALSRVEIRRSPDLIVGPGLKVFIVIFSSDEIKSEGWLRPYVKYSGFQTTDEWVAEAERLSGKPDNWALYLVVLQGTWAELPASTATKS